MNDSLGSNPLSWTAVGGVFGATAALAVGILALLITPDNGVADLAAAALTRVVLIPAGAVGGAVIGYRQANRRTRPRR